MDLRQYLEGMQNQLAAAAEAGGAEARALLERLLPPVEAAMRLSLQDALTAAAEEITVELAPGSVELRLRGRELEFVVTPPPVDAPMAAGGPGYGGSAAAGNITAAATTAHSASAAGSAGSAGTANSEGDEGGMSRINLRLPEQLKTRIEQAAAAEGLSVNAWLVRATAAAVDRGTSNSGHRDRAPQAGQRYTGWVR